MKRTFLISGLASLLIACEGGKSTNTSTDADLKNTDTSASVAEAPRITTPGFEDVAARVGLDFIHSNGATAEKFFPEIMGAGGALFDMDNDGDLDVLLLHSDRVNETTPTLFEVPDREQSIVLFENRLVPDGSLAFTDVSADSGLSGKFYGMGVATGDLNADGLPDVYVTNLETNALYLNQGAGRFKRENSGVAKDDEGWSTSASFIDYDLDGALDLFVTRYVDVDLTNARRCTSSTGQRDYCTPSVYRPLNDLLLRGDGSGKLTPVKNWHAGPPVPSTGLGVVVADYNNDGWPDIYVANDKNANQLWLNLKNGQFEETAVMNGGAYDANGKAEASMGVTSGDVDADGDEDLFITHLRGESNTLYLNEGNAMFLDSTIVFKLSSTSLPSTGFGTRWFDPDNDGDLDLFAANGAVMIEGSQLGQEPFPYVQANQIFEHQANLQFIDASEAAGFSQEKPEVSRGAAFGDIDNDGDVDILVTNNNGPVRLLLNPQQNNNAWLSVQVIGSQSNRDGVGARIGLLRENATTLWKRVGTDGSYLSASDQRVHFGLGSATKIKGIVVRWPGGKEERFAKDALNTFIQLTEGNGEPMGAQE